ncbi:Cyclic nucleotide-binding protein [Pseudocohnilembus persalinus]|uniref:Cyclic nucleotide-binding protein n=1 Tax=Pseudocohnilembus persalinus TaxID=266149 RepID=A0A0V0R030_PSEPJ|nr:Cyclic nucleotide-binding protein [Pseudocohnilembus persalinus]|eukprot:KRX07894.1 Cyclic nucleotide-binding protein [Pseudocohnilembus persalinus]
MAGVKLIYVILITSHIFSIIWLAIGKYQYDRQLEPNWYLAYELNKKEWISGYLISYYFNMVTMVTVGYGDIGPQSEIEMLLCIATMFISCAVFAYALNQIDYIFRELYMFESQIRENMAIINNYMLQKNISKNLQFQIRQYLDYVWREQEKDQILDNNILMQLSDILQEKLLLEANKIVLIDSPVFKNNFSETIIQKTVPLIREQKCTPQENILIDNSRDNCSIYFIEKGEVEVYLKPRNELNIEKNQNLQILKKGDHFGTISFFTGQPQQFSIRSIQFSSLLMIKRQDFIKLIQEYQEDYQKFCFIRDLITINSDFRKIHQKCYSCQSDYHQIDQCPFLHLNVNRNLLMRKIAYNIIQERENKIRLYKKQFNLGQLQLINEKMIQFHEKENKALDEYEHDNNLKLDEQNELVFSDLSFSEQDEYQYTQNNNEQNKNIIISSNTSSSSQSKNSINTIQEEDEQNNSSIDTENSSSSKNSKNQVIQEKNKKSYLSQKKIMNQTQSNEIEASSGGSLGISQRISQEYIQKNKNNEFDEDDFSKSETSFSLQQSIMIDNKQIQQYSLKIRIWQELERQRKLNNVCSKSQNTLQVIKDDEQSICSNDSLTITSFSKNIKSYFYLNDEFNFSDERKLNNNKNCLDYDGSKFKNSIFSSEEQRKNLKKISYEIDKMEKSQDNQISCFDKHQYPKIKQNFQGFNMDDDLIFSDNKQEIPQVKITNYDENKKLYESKNQLPQQNYIQQNSQVQIEKQINSNLTKECLDKLPKNKYRYHNNVNSKNSVRKIKKKEDAFGDFPKEDEDEILSRKQTNNQESQEAYSPQKMVQSKKRNSQSRISSLKKQQDLNQFLSTAIKHVKMQTQNLNSSSDKENDKQNLNNSNLLGFSKQVRQSNISNKMNMSRSFAAAMNRSILKKTLNSPHLGPFNKSTIMNNKNAMSQSRMRMHSQLYFDGATNKYKFPINHRKQINSNQANNNDKNNESDLSLIELENVNNKSEKISQMVKNTPAFMLKPRRSLKSQKFPDQINKIFFQNINSLPKINIESNKNSNDDITVSQYSQQFSLIQSPNNRIDQSLISKEQDSKQSNRPLLN